ncbi:MAG TPA: tetratricopeptide repeat protein [Nitrospiria bacterium]|jgi:tetratricopeptide (TPR) repeat protein
MNPNIEKGRLLIQQSRYPLAEEEFRKGISNDPEDPIAHALLAVSLSRQKKYDESVQNAKTAIGLAPDLGYCHYVLASVLDDKDQTREAETAIREAIRLEPDDADYLALLGSLLLQQRRWKEALQVVEEGLREDPEHVECANFRAMALNKLGRKEEASASIEGALARDPDNASTHARRGWILLEQGDQTQALENFREALRINPQMVWAREGIVEALKARNILYRVLLKYFFWMSNFSPKVQWGIIIGAFFFIRFLREMGRENPDLAPFVFPLMGAYLLFVLLTWVADSLFNLLLRLDRFGRLALSSEQLLASNWIGGCLFSGFAGIGGWLLMENILLLFAGVGSGLLMIPISGIFRANQGKGRNFLIAYTIGLAGFGMISLGLGLSGFQSASVLGILFFAGCVLSTWISNAVILRS